MIKASMPHPPESFKAVVVKHASAHVINYMNTIHLGPYLCSSPDNKELEPNEKKVH